jgi:carbonic anhydrase
MKRLISTSKTDEILPEYRGGPIGRLLEYHNLGRPFDEYAKAQLLIGMCMDNRKQLRLPGNFAYVIRTGGGNLKFSEFKVSFAIALGGVRAIALISHTDCGMVNLLARRERFIDGLVEHAGWKRERAAEHFDQSVSHFEIRDPLVFVSKEAERLRGLYPRIQVGPLLYRVEDNRLYQIQES